MSRRKASPHRKPPDRELQLWCGQQLLLLMREMFDDFGLGAGFDFHRWVDAAPLPPAGRRAIALARQAARPGEQE